MSSDPFPEYTQTFVQRIPRFVLKPRNGGWRTIHKPLGDGIVRKHLDGRHHVASLGRWYPTFMIIDNDRLSLEQLETMREDLDLNATNSLLFTSETAGHHHLIIKINHGGEPVTIARLTRLMRNVARYYGIEVYPQARRGVRLPFGPCQKSLYPEHSSLKTWQQKFAQFQHMRETDLAGLPLHQDELDLQVRRERVVFPELQDTPQLLVHGLQGPGTREAAQFQLLYSYWRNNVPLQTAIQEVWQWIKTKNNDYSEEFKRWPKQVRKHITRQARQIYSTYDQRRIYPDVTHNLHHGYITEPDIRDIVEVCRGSLPRMRFLFELVKYVQPRRHQILVSIHSEKFIGWSSKSSYLKYVNEFEEKAIIKRFSAYSVGHFSKGVQLQWQWRGCDEAVLYDGRSVDTLESTVRLLYEPDEFRQLLKNANTNRTTAIEVVKKIYEEGVKNVETY